MAENWLSVAAALGLQVLVVVPERARTEERLAARRVEFIRRAKLTAERLPREFVRRLRFRAAERKACEAAAAAARAAERAAALERTRAINRERAEWREAARAEELARREQVARREHVAERRARRAAEQ